MHRIMMVLWQHILRNLLLHYIHQAGTTPTIFFSCFLFKKIKYMFFLQKKKHIFLNYILLQVGKQIFKILDQRNEAWSRMSYLGWRPLKALGHKRAKEFWTHIGDNCIFKGKINPIYIFVSGFPANNLISKILFDHIREIAVLIGFIADKEFLHRYCLVPRIPMVGNATRVLALFNFRFMILATNIYPIHI